MDGGSQTLSKLHWFVVILQEPTRHSGFWLTQSSEDTQHPAGKGSRGSVIQTPSAWSHFASWHCGNLVVQGPLQESLKKNNKEK